MSFTDHWCFQFLNIHFIPTHYPLAVHTMSSSTSHALRYPHDLDIRYTSPEAIDQVKRLVLLNWPSDKDPRQEYTETEQMLECLYQHNDINSLQGRSPVTSLWGSLPETTVHYMMDELLKQFGAIVSQRQVYKNCRRVGPGRSISNPAATE